ncbi:isoaspartyl peptidase/L-asparaginase family protein [Hymenobacter qilianensis]|uniref:isoaspartyl peptidase/L-asparaginase family protein n=1 Tax=Hymenobacter qilianensis TaxID=1385715 RepID=UPI00293BCD6A|nr:isoaspartyl peptidase/L-asparaginase [Hymenobacter qilianensis]
MPSPSFYPATLLLHGGSGRLHPPGTPFPQQAAYTRTLSEAAHAGYAVLTSGGTSLDAVETSLQLLEDSPLFNAGRGSVFSRAGVNEMDAALMDGATLRAGAVAGVRTVKNPITAARAVLERSPYVLLTGAGADEFAAHMGLETAPAAWFRTEERWQQWQALQGGAAPGSTRWDVDLPATKYGTVGAVALDQAGHLAAGTSTGGMLNKAYGRVGDSPLIGAGTYANHGCAVSGTGHGEYFIRHAVAHDIAAIVEYTGLGVQEAAQQVIDKVARAGGEGALLPSTGRGTQRCPTARRGCFGPWSAPMAGPKPTSAI